MALSKLGTIDFHIACYRGDVEGLRGHKAAGGSLTLASSNGWTGYHRSAYNNKPGSLRYLLEEGAGNIDAVTTGGPWKGKTALMMAADDGSLECGWRRGRGHELVASQRDR